MNLEFDGFKIDTYIEDYNLFLAVGGSHSFGWRKPTSDLDLREVWIPSFDKALSLFNKPNIHQTMSSTERGIVDLTKTPLSHFLVTLAKGNGNYLENLFGLHLLENKTMVKELQTICLKNIHVGFLKHYLGYATGLLHDMNVSSRLEKYGMPKLILQTYRVLLAGEILHITNKVVFNLNEQNKYWSTAWCLSLLESYLKGEAIDESTTKLAMDEITVLYEDLESFCNLIMPNNNLKVALEKWYLKLYQSFV